MKRKILNFLLVGVLVVNCLCARDAWEWDTIDTSQVVFNKSNFLFGVAIAEYQNSGAKNLPDCNWAAWEKKGSTIKNNQTSQVACDFWNRYKDDINLITDLGCNACRLSIDWSKIEPQQGQFDRSAIQHYHDVIDALLSKGVVPMVTLHHFVHPQWFEEMGAFEKEENIPFFVRFCELVFGEFSSQVRLWCPINEPGPFVLCGYILGTFPPGRIYALSVAGEVLKNLLKAHIAVYKALKKLPYGADAHIGFIHQYLNMDGYYLWDKAMVNILPFRYVLNSAILDFLKTGIFSFKQMLVFGAEFEDQDIKTSMDFIGLNYYSEAIVRNFKPGCYDNEIMTDMPYAIYAEGFYTAIKEMAQFGKPLYITENGIADVRDDRRELFIKRYLYALSKAMKDFNADVRGYFYWTLMDNFEWDNGRLYKFGLYSTDFATQKRCLRSGAQCIKQFFK
jgi:beta-glucosidase